VRGTVDSAGCCGPPDRHAKKITTLGVASKKSVILWDVQLAGLNPITAAQVPRTLAPGFAWVITRSRCGRGHRGVMCQ